MARSIGVFGAECRSKGIDSSKCRSTKLTLELSRDGQICLLSEEILRVVHLSFLCHLVEVECCHLEHLTGTLSVAGSDKWRIEVVEPVVMEVLVDGDSHIMPDAEHSTECIGTQTHMSELAHILEALALLLHRIIVRAETIDDNFLGLNLNGLTLALAFDESTLHTDTCTGGNTLQFLSIDGRRIDDHLQILYRRAIVEGDEVNSLTAAVRPRPSFYYYIFSIVGTL